MSSTFQKIPFLRITMAFAAGIVLGKFWILNNGLTLIVAVAILSLAFVLHLKYTYKTEPIWGGFAILLFVALGHTIYSHKNTKPVFYQNGTALATVIEKPQLKTNSYKSELHITTISNGDSIQKFNERILVYFAKTDDVTKLEPGTQILIKTVPRQIQNTGTPYTFNYRNYLNNQYIYRQIYLGDKDWTRTNREKFSLLIYAEQIREKLLEIYRNQNLGESQTQILSALTLGYKRDLDPETKRIFSAAGAMHVLAVSGLHVGIIFMVFAYLFGRLRRQKTGKYIFMATAILLLWVYAFITGLSPSVLRASTMFTIIIIGSNIDRRASVYNSLAASALLLLLFNPNHLFEVGFQLSYSAVFGIVFLQPRLAKLWRIKNKPGRFFWNLFTVSVAAQIATFPLAAYYFNQFPLFFWLTNFIVIPAATLLIPLGIALLLTAQIPFISLVLATIIKTIITLVYISLKWIEALPFSLLHFSLYHIELLFLIIFFFLLFLFIAKHKVSYFKYSLVAILLLCSSILFQNLQQRQSKELIVYTDSNTCIQLISGRKNYVISTKGIDAESFLYRQIKSVNLKKRLYEPTFLSITENFEDKILFQRNGLLFFNEKTIAIDKTMPNAKLTPDFLILTKYRQKNKLIVDNKTTIINTSYLPKQQENAKLHSIKNHGTFIEKW